MSDNPFNNNLPNQVGAICDAIDKQPKIVQCIQACNEEKLIEACMLQLYDKVDRIVVIEGAVQSKVAAGQATPDGHSLDRTVEIIKDVKDNKDPDRKIVFVQIDRPWQDLEELKNTFFQYMQEGDWMLITDADEFIHPEVVDELRKAISIEPWATEFVPAGFYHFWRDAYHIRKPSGDWGQQHQRFIRFQPGLNYANHPVARDANGVCTYFDPRYLSRRFVLPSFVVYHYSYCKDNNEEIRAKKEFYDKELGQDKHGDVGAYARGGQTDEYLNQTEDLDTVLRFDNKHPLIMEGHSVTKHRDSFLARKDLAYFDGPDGVEPYNLKDIPLIWIFAKEKKQGYDKFFNTVEV
jgi:glycosyltransferase involved in cell wall biosynthesis